MELTDYAVNEMLKQQKYIIVSLNEIKKLLENQAVKINPSSDEKQ